MPIKDREKYNEYTRKYLAKKYEKRRQEFVELLGGVCVKCSATENLYLSPSADATPNYNLKKKMNNANYEELRAEVLKHFLICASCSAKKRNGVEHGGGASGVRNCKCAPCKAKKSEFMKNYNAERKKKQQED